MSETASGGTSEEFLTGPYGTLSATSGTTVQAYLPDALGSVLALVNSAGQIATSYSYNVFGATTSSAGARDPNPVRYTSLISGATIPGGLQDNNARDYSPATSRFISADPSGQTGSGDNLYQYADDDTADFSDPSGLEVPELIACGIGALANDIGGALDGRKHSFGDYFAGAGLGCLGGFLLTIPGGIEELEALEAADFAVLGTDGSEDLTSLGGDLDDEGAGDDEGGEDSCAANSFASHTKVKLSSGKSKPISNFRPGDKVLAADPRSGKTTDEPVQAVITGHKNERFVRLTIIVGNGSERKTGTIVATAGHPFFDFTRNRWIDAGQLRVGDRLDALDGGTAEIAAMHRYDYPGAAAYNLTVGNDHTYFIGVAGTAVLVHNCGEAELGNRLEYFFGNATGSAHNIERSQEMLASLSRIGITNDAEGRALLEDFLQSQYDDKSSISSEENGKTIRDGLLAGPGGFAKMETVWRGAKLITGLIYSGG